MTDQIVGHYAQRKSLRQLLASERLPHSMLFVGNAGIGKKLVALELAQMLFCEDNNRAEIGGCGECSKCKLFESGSIADLYQIDCLDKEAANVAQIRQLLQTVNLKAFHGGARVTVLDNAEHLSVQSSNILLKTLEEPRGDSYFILIVENPAKLPDTILSRCQRWFFSPLSNDQIRDVIDRKNLLPEGVSIQDVITLLDGSLQGVSSIVDKLDRFSNFKDRVNKILAGDKLNALEFAKELSSDRESLRESLHLMRMIVRERVLNETDPKNRRSAASLQAHLLELDALIFERNINAQYLLQSRLLNDL
ncbi:MAG: AAA family ATPase [Deltaproteobacteria bacterium]|nr:AAA family ATPase [Deltaproteobacteria bacterium]